MTLIVYPVVRITNRKIISNVFKHSKLPKGQHKQTNKAKEKSLSDLSHEVGNNVGIVILRLL